MGTCDARNAPCLACHAPEDRADYVCAKCMKARFNDERRKKHKLSDMLTEKFREVKALKEQHSIRVVGLIRIGVGKPTILQSTGRWGEPEAHWYVREPCYVSVDQWLKLLWFESPVPKFMPTMVRSVEDEVRDRMKLSGMNAVWQFDALTMDLKDRMRMVAVLGEPMLVPWTWADYYIRRPLLKLACWFMNTFGRAIQVLGFP